MFLCCLGFLCSWCMSYCHIFYFISSNKTLLHVYIFNVEWVSKYLRTKFLYFTFLNEIIKIHNCDQFSFYFIFLVNAASQFFFACMVKAIFKNINSFVWWWIKTIKERDRERFYYSILFLLKHNAKIREIKLHWLSLEQCEQLMQ